jgi:putative ABC transport system permease protein
VSRLLTRSGWRFFARHPWQLALAIAGVALGVAVVSGVDLAAEPSRTAFDLSRQAVTGRATHQISSPSGDFDEAVFRELRVELGVRDSAPIVEGRVRLPDGRVLTLVGVDSLSERGFRDYGTAARSSGRLEAMLTMPGSVLATPDLAREAGLGGGGFRVVADGEVHTLHLVGELAPSPTNALVLREFLFADVSTAQEVLGSIGRLSRIDLIVDAETAARIADRLPPGVTLGSTAARARHMQEMTRAFRINLLALSLLALLVGAFLIYSTMSFLVVQRRNVIGTLRTIGVTRRQLFAAIIRESMLVGVPGTAIGLALGWLLGQGLTELVVRTIDDLYFRLQVTGGPTDWVVFAKGAVLGLGATVLASLGPAAEASAVAPRAVLSRASLERRARRRLPALAVAAAVVAAFSWWLFGLESRSLVAGFAGMFGVIASAALLVPPATVVLMDTLSRLPPRAIGMPVRMAIRSVSASLSRTGVAVAALTVAVATVIGVGLMIGSFRASVDQWLKDSLRSDVYVNLSEAWYAAGGDGDALAHRLESLPETRLVTRSARTRLSTEDGEIRLWALDTGEGEWGLALTDGDPRSARERFRAGVAVAVSEPFSRRVGLGVGDEVRLPVGGAVVELPVAAIFRDYTSDRGVVAIHMDRYRELWGFERIGGLGLVAADGIAPDRLREAADAVIGDAAGVRVNSNSEIRAASLAIFDRTFTITRVLQLLVGIVAFLGILSALQSLQMERVREMAVLRSIGWAPGQVRRLVVAQTALLGLIAGLFAIPLGLTLAFVLVRVINLRAFAWTMSFEPDAVVLLQGVTLAIAAAFIGGLYPAWRSARRRPALDLRDE